MSALAERWADTADPDTLAGAALEAPRCECERPILDGDECGYCGKKIREPGTLGRDFRRAAYDRRLRWARGAGLDARSDFQGLSYQLGTRRYRRSTRLSAPASSRRSATPRTVWMAYSREGCPSVSTAITSSRSPLRRRAT